MAPSAGGAIINTSLKSGTNAIHGSAFGYFRDQIFDASPDYLSPTTPTLSFQRKQFGIAAGGPLLKNRVFLFGAYQGLRQKTPQDQNFVTVPTALMRMGNFGELLGTGLTSVPTSFAETGCRNTIPVNGGIYDPLTCQQFSQNTIPTNRINVAGLSYLKAFPAPTRPGILNNYFVIRQQIQNYNDIDVRLDFHVSQKDSVFVRGSCAQDNQTVTSLFTTLPAGFASGISPNPSTRARRRLHARLNAEPRQ